MSGPAALDGLRGPVAIDGLRGPVAVDEAVALVVCGAAVDLRHERLIHTVFSRATPAGHDDRYEGPNPPARPVGDGLEAGKRAMGICAAPAPDPVQHDD